MRHTGRLLASKQASDEADGIISQDCNPETHFSFHEYSPIWNIGFINKIASPAIQQSLAIIASIFNFIRRYDYDKKTFVLLTNAFLNSEKSGDSDLIGIEDLPQFQSDYYPTQDDNSTTNLVDDQVN